MSKLLISVPAPLYGFASNRMDVFWKASDGSLMDTWWNGSAWVESQLSAQPMGSAPAPLHGFANNRMDVLNKTLRWTRPTLAAGCIDHSGCNDLRQSLSCGILVAAV